jgi:hypothetical protein
MNILRSTKNFTAGRNVLQQYEIFYSRTKYFTAGRNVLQQDKIFYSRTKCFTGKYCQANIPQRNAIQRSVRCKVKAKWLEERQWANSLPN